MSFDEKRTASLSAPLPGRVEKVLVRIGDRVNEGDRLFNVRSAAWADLEREMASARANVEVKKRIAARARELVDIRAVPEKDALAAEADLHEADLAARASAAKRASLRIAPEGDNLFWVVAPRSGKRGDPRRGRRARRSSPRETSRWSASPSCQRCWCSPTCRRATPTT